MPPNTLDYSDDITCIDTEQQRAGMACCYLLRGGDRYAFIECGTSLSVPGLLNVLQQRGIAREQIAYVIPTHVHLDHAGGVGRMLRELPNAKLVVHPRGARHMIDPSKLIAGATAVYGAEHMAAMYGEILPAPEARVIVAEDDFKLDLNGRELWFIDAPGHASHHFAVWDARSRGWFTGDVFGLSYREFDGPNGPYLLPTTTPVQFDPAAWMHTLDRLLAADPQWIYLTHYGRIGNVAKLAADLRRGLAEYQQLAAHYRTDANRHQSLKRALTEHELAKIAALNSPVDAEEARELLELDMDLNAQGLEVWLDRK
jgi:glyoxylase-like metal-dependent hydrolase (beta-lactamase superfamily II)